MRLKYILLLFLIFAGRECIYAGADTTRTHYRLYTEKSIKLLAGAQLQMTEDEEKKTHSRKYMELGLHISTVHNLSPAHPQSAFTYGPSLEFAPGSVNIYGFKFSSWVSADLFVFGFSTVYYTDFHRGNFKIRPEIGLGFYAAKLTAGINIPTIGNADFDPLRKSLAQLSLNILIKAKTIKKTEYPVPDYFKDRLH